jgi:hypothetical protein
MNLLVGVLSLYALVATVGWLVALWIARDLRNERDAARAEAADAYAKGQHDILQDTDSMAGLRRRFDLGKALDEQIQVVPMPPRRGLK